MCKLFSCIVHRNGTVYTSKNGWETSHTKIAKDNNLVENGKAELNRAKFEIYPMNLEYRNPKHLWVINLDENGDDYCWVKQSHYNKAQRVFERWFDNQFAPILALHSQKVRVSGLGTVVGITNIDNQSTRACIYSDLFVETEFGVKPSQTDRKLIKRILEIRSIPFVPGVHMPRTKL